MSAYGDQILRALRTPRSLREAGLLEDYQSAAWEASERRTDNWLFVMCLVCIPILTIELIWRI